MFASYRRLFALPGALAFTLSGLLGRLAFSMTGVSTVLLVTARRDSYALAGAVTAVGTVATALGLPLLGRLVDRYGQRRVARPGVLCALGPLLGLPLCAYTGAPAWTLLLCAAAASVLPNLGGMARARWAHLLRADPAARQTANSFEQVLDELCFTAGPVLGTLLCTTLLPEAGLLAAAALGCTGTLLFAAQRRTEPPVTPAADRATNGALRVGGLRVLVPAFFAAGLVFGSIEVSTVAYADAAGQRPLAGGLLAMMAAGSAVSGLLLGLARPRRSPAARLLAGAAAMAALLLLPLAAGLAGAGPWLLAPALLLAGAGTAPTMVAGLSLVQELVPAGQLNEAMGLTVSGILAGISTGAALGGTLAQHTTGAGTAAPGLGYALPAGAALLALLTVLLGYRRLRPAAAAPGQTYSYSATVVPSGSTRGRSAVRTPPSRS
ncbi:MFS transporter [Kitasatospora sp. MMS16-BH015]|uniref:MFS transporter n=1 Tax=Kitasatospora sp. MMS16-BH015 TaxID=2018025 RepID=UPI000CA36BA6|nr:MFS transporter [Kitasatospora sp. MMS16-BH015]